MARSFEKSLRPPFDKPSVSMSPELKWRLDEHLLIAEKNATKIDICGDRNATIYLNKNLSLGENDRKSIERIAGRNFQQDSEVRSLWLKLDDPIDEKRGNPRLPVTSVQIKGVVFDADNPLVQYYGAGWPREIYFADRNGIVQRYDAPKEGAIGRCLLKEAVNEYLMCMRAASYLITTKVHVPLAVGWGKFNQSNPSEKEFGFVILGLPDLMPGREAVYLAAAEVLDRTHDFTEMDKLLRLRSHAIRTMNKCGFVVPGRHFGNMSLTPDREAFMHDLGPPHSLFKENFHNDNQFVAEAFAQLAYAITPRKVVVPVPSKDSAARRVTIDFLDQYTKSSLEGYYTDNPKISDVTFENFEETFFASLTKPLHEIDLLPAKVHCGMFNAWQHPKVNLNIPALG